MEYHIGRDGRTFGPYPEARVEGMIRSGELLPHDLCWREGMPDWEPLGRHFPVAFPPGAAERGEAAPSMPDAREPLPTRDLSGVCVSEHGTLAPVMSEHAYSSVSPDFSFAAQPQAPLAGRAARLGAALLDLLLLGSPVLLLFGPDAMRAFHGSGAPDAILVPIFLFFGGILAILLVQIFFLTRDGQSLGKKALRLRIVGLHDDRPPGFVRTVLLRALANGVLIGVPFFGALYFLADSLTIFSEDRRCIHDHIAGTRVVRG